jgi:hypothetical protein
VLTSHTPIPDFEGTRIERDILNSGRGEELRADPDDLGLLRRLGASLD